MEDQLPTAGIIAGGALGSEAPGLGNIVGAGLGGAAGTEARRLMKGEPLTKQAAVDVGVGAAQGAGAEMGGQIIGKGVELAAPQIAKLLPEATTKTARSLYERGVVPSGLSAEDQELMRENFGRAQKYIANETRGYPIKTGEGGAMSSARIAHQAGENLWNRSVEPVIDAYKDVQRPGSTIGDSIRSSFTDLDRQTRGGAVKAGEDLAKYFDGKTLTVGQMQDMVTQLNNDKGVARFYDMSPNEQAAAELADPALRGKLATVRSLRESMFDAIGETGGDQVGDGFREARKDWGAIRSVEDQVRGAKVPTPQPWWTKVANTVRGSLSPKGTDFWLRGSDTLFDFNNPDRLIPKAFNTLGKTDLQVPRVEPTPITVGGVPSRQLPPVGGSQPSNPNAVPGVRDPSFEGQPPANVANQVPPIQVQPNAVRIMSPVSAGPGEGPAADLRNSRGAASTIKPRIGSVQNVPGPPPTDALATQPPGTMVQTLGRPPYMPGAPIDAEYVGEGRAGQTMDGVNAMPSSGRTIVPPRPGVEIMPGAPELNVGPPAATELPRNPERALPPVNPRNPSGAIEVGPSTRPPAPQNRQLTAASSIQVGRSTDAPPETGPIPEPQKPTPETPKSPAGAAAAKPVDLGTPKDEPAKPLTKKEVKLAKLEDRTAAAPKERAPREPREQIDDFHPDTLDEAKQQLAALSDMWGQMPRPGIFSHNAFEEVGEEREPRGSGNVTFGISSARPSMEAEFPWLKNLPKVTDGKIRAALESGKGVEYNRLVNEAGRHIQQMKADAPAVIEELGQEIDEATATVEKDDPELAQTLRDIKAGKYSGMSGLRKFIKENVDAAKAFDTAIFDTTTDETEGSAAGSRESGGRNLEEEAREVTPQKNPVLPGLEKAVAENKKSAAVELGRKLTDKINEPAKSIESAAGEMETKSPLFRGTSASPQNEMFGKSEPTQERRSPQNAEQRRRLSEMSREEMHHELTTSQVTGLPNGRAFEEAEKSPAVGMSDADGLKAFNDKFGYDEGNKLLKAKADALKEAGLDAYHEKGDEFLYRGANPEELNAKLEKAREILRNREFTIKQKDGTVLRLKGVDFSYGTDAEKAGAEQNLKNHKAEREAKGERARGEFRGSVEVGPRDSGVNNSSSTEEK